MSPEKALDLLKKLEPAQFEELLLRLGVELAHMPGIDSPLSMRAAKLIKLCQQSDSELHKLEELLQVAVREPPQEVSVDYTLEALTLPVDSISANGLGSGASLASVFISHKKPEDNSRFNILRTLLSNTGTACWSSDEMTTAKSLGDQLRDAIYQCECCVFIATKDSVGSSWCLTEVGAFWGARKRVIVYLTKGVRKEDLPPALEGQFHAQDIAKVVLDVQRELEQAKHQRQSKLIAQELFQDVPGALIENIDNEPVITYMTQRFERLSKELFSPNPIPKTAQFRFIDYLHEASRNLVRKELQTTHVHSWFSGYKYAAGEHSERIWRALTFKFWIDRGKQRYFSISYRWVPGPRLVMVQLHETLVNYRQQVLGVDDLELDISYKSNNQIHRFQASTPTLKQLFDALNKAGSYVFVGSSSIRFFRGSLENIPTVDVVVQQEKADEFVEELKVCLQGLPGWERLSLDIASPDHDAISVWRFSSENSSVVLHVLTRANSWVLDQFAAHCIYSIERKGIKAYYMSLEDALASYCALDHERRGSRAHQAVEREVGRAIIEERRGLSRQRLARRLRLIGASEEAHNEAFEWLARLEKRTESIRDERQKVGGKAFVFDDSWDKFDN